MPAAELFPAPVVISRLTRYFEKTYQLGTGQAEQMVDSSRRSLEKILAHTGVALQSDDAGGEMVKIGHSLKGVLLIMGEGEWADVARDLERSARQGECRNYARILAGLAEGMAAVLGYEKSC